MKITITSAAPSREGLRLGLRVEYGKGGPIRFATTVLVVDQLDNGDRQSLVQALDKARFRWDADEDHPRLFG